MEKKKIQVDFPTTKTQRCPGTSGPGKAAEHTISGLGQPVSVGSVTAGGALSGRMIQLQQAAEAWSQAGGSPTPAKYTGAGRLLPACGSLLALFFPSKAGGGSGEQMQVLGKSQGQAGGAPERA